MKYIYFLFFTLLSSLTFAEECTHTVKPNGQTEIFCANPDLMPHTESFSGSLKTGFKDKKGNLVIPAEWDFAGLFTEGFAPVNRNGKWGYINTQGQLIIPLTYDNADNFWQGVAKVEKNCQSFHIDKQGYPTDNPKEISGCIPDGVMKNPEQLKKWLEKQSL